MMEPRFERLDAGVSLARRNRHSVASPSRFVVVARPVAARAPVAGLAITGTVPGVGDPVYDRRDRFQSDFQHREIQRLHRRYRQRRPIYSVRRGGAGTKITREIGRCAEYAKSYAL